MSDIDNSRDSEDIKHTNAETLMLDNHTNSDTLTLERDTRSDREYI